MARECTAWKVNIAISSVLGRSFVYKWIVPDSLYVVGNLI